MVKLILQFLKENHLYSTMHTLQEEAQVTLNTVDNLDKFVADIMHGRWDQVLEVVNNLRVSETKLIDLFEQIILEMAELREVDTARAILRGTPAMQTMKKEYPDRYLRLEHILQKTYFDYAEAYPGGSTKESRRQLIAQSFKPDVTVVQPSRLLALVTQALKWQQYQGLLPKGAKYDLFRGAAPQEALEEEKVPDENSKVIKFGKKSFPEIARFSPDGQWLISGSSDGFVEVWDYDSGKLAKELKYQAEDDFMMHDTAVNALVFSRDGEYIATGDSSGAIKVWKLSTGVCVRKFPTAHSQAITSLEFARDSTQLLSASYDATIRIHGLKSGRTLKEFRGHKSFVHAAVYSDDGSQIISGSADGNVKVWDAKTTDCLKTFKPNSSVANAVAVLNVVRIPRQMDRFLIVTKDKTVRMMTKEGQLIQSYNVPATGDVVAACMSPKGRYVFVVADDQVLYCFTSEQASLEHFVKLHEKDVMGIAQHPSRNIFASFAQDGTLKLWRPGKKTNSAVAATTASIPSTST